MKKENTLRFRIEGMTCSACSSRIEKVLNALPEIESASVSLASSTATINLAENTLFAQKTNDESNLTKSSTFVEASALMDSENFASMNKIIANRVEQLGFKAVPISPHDNSQKLWEEEQHRLFLEMHDKKKRLIIEIIFSLPIVIIAMGAHVGMPLPSIISMHDNPLNFALIQLILLLPVCWSGRDFYLRGIPNLLHGAPNMDSLVAIGTGSAFLYSVWSTYEIFIAQSPEAMHMAVMGIYYESYAMLITLISLGKFLELRSKTKTQDAIKGLMDLSPKTVSLVTDDGSFIEIAAEKILLGDRIFIRPGKQIPVDGIVIEGSSSLDMSAITGEFMPVRVQINDKATSGSINIGGAFTMKAEHVGADTVLAKIISLVQEAQGSKAPIARLADNVSLYFVPVVMVLALLSGLAWYYIGNVPFGEALKIFVAVMVVACPCALGLATPMSVMVATGRAAKLGLLIKNGTALELAGKVDTIVFDKTGTLTEGKPHLNIEYAFSTENMENISSSILENPLYNASNDESDQKKLNYEKSNHEKSQHNGSSGNGSSSNDSGSDANKEKYAFIMQLGSSMEQNSDHPLAKAFILGLQKSKPNTESNGNDKNAHVHTSIVENANSASEMSTEFYEFENFEEVSGRGIHSTLLVKKPNSSRNFRVSYYIGNMAFMHENNIALTDEEKKCVEKIMQEGKSPLIFGQATAKTQQTQNTQLDTNSTALSLNEPSNNKTTRSYTLPFFEENSKIIAIFSVEDRIRDESKELIQQLKQMGISPMLLSGDNTQSVYAVAKKVGIEKENCMAEVLPTHKEAQIRHLQAQNRIVAMVGDGINDAPALAKADVGMVMGNGMDIAMEAGDLVLLRGITGILNALRLSRATIKNIRLSLFWAFAYNILLLPVAAGFFLLFGGPSLSPMLAGAAMAFSSFSVVSNALRLRNFK